MGGREEASEELDKARKELRKVSQQLSKATKEQELLSRKLEEKERQLQQTTRDLRDAKDKSSAAAVRARRAQVLGSRTSRSAASSTSPVKSQGTITPDPSAETSDTNETSTIREKVLALLEKHDKGKVNRIDIIMEKFKGKEALLLEKMTQRYEGDAPSGDSIQKRNELAMERHKERMKKKLEKQNGGG